MKISRKTETVQHTRIQLTGRDIMNMLAAANRIKITKETKVFFTVPTGGDYSGITLEIDKDNPITVSSKSYDRISKL
jgi:hypothetical protein